MCHFTLRGLLGWSLMVLGVSLVFHDAIPTCCIAEEEAAKTPVVSGEAKIRAALKGATDVEVDEMPLQEVVDYLRDVHQIQMQLDQRALDEEGIAADTPITYHSKGISLQSTLNLMLRPLDLTAVVAEGVLLITSCEAADRWIEVRTYDVSPLLTKADEPDAEEVADLLTMMIATPPAKKPQPTGTAGMGGTGGGMGGGMFNVGDSRLLTQFSHQSTKIFSYHNLLVVRTSLPKHDRIKQLLDALTEQVQSAD